MISLMLKKLLLVGQIGKKAEASWWQVVSPPDCGSGSYLTGAGTRLKTIVLDLISKHTPISSQSSNFTFIHSFIKSYVVGTHLNCLDLSRQFNEYPQHMIL